MSGTILKIGLVCVLVAGTGGLVAWGAGAFDGGASTPIVPRDAGAIAPMTDATTPAKGDGCCPVSGKGSMPAAAATMDGSGCIAGVAMDGADACTGVKAAIATTAGTADADCGDCDKTSCGTADAGCDDCVKTSCGTADAGCDDGSEKASCGSKAAGCGSKGSCEVEEPIDN